MHRFYKEFIEILETENREASLQFVLSKLERKEVDIVTLYTQLLAPSLNTMVHDKEDLTFIWREHIRSSIIRTIIENCYPYVIKERDERYKVKTDKRVAVVCPSEELHELGARMATDFFTLLGFDGIFVGSNTPKEEYLQAMKKIKLDYIAISVSGSYNLIAARNTIEKIREANLGVSILVGGNAFQGSDTTYKMIGADKLINTIEDIRKLTEEDTYETSI